MAELVALDIDDVPLTALTGVVIVRASKGADSGATRRSRLAADARSAVKAWLDNRAPRPGACSTPACSPTDGAGG